MIFIIIIIFLCVLKKVDGILRLPNVDFTYLLLPLHPVVAREDTFNATAGFVCN